MSLKTIDLIFSISFILYFIWYFIIFISNAHTDSCMDRLLHKNIRLEFHGKNMKKPQLQYGVPLKMNYRFDQEDLAVFIATDIFVGRYY